MASSKNTNRHKRKYGDARKSRTERNRKIKQQRHEARHARLVARTQSLIGKSVRVRSKEQTKPLVGTVLEVITKDDDHYPRHAHRHVGRYLKVRTAIGEMVASRHRVKPTKDNQ